MRRRKVQGALAGVVFCTGFFMMLLQTSLVPDTGTRRLESKTDESAKRLGDLYKIIFSSDVGEEMQKIHKKVRTEAECEVHPDEDTPPEGFDGTDHIDSHITTISCVPVHYRIPTASIQGIEDSMVFGVLSPGRKAKPRRDTIRKTWGKDSTVFFIVAGDWADIEEEYNNNRDLLWVDQEEIYRNKVTDSSPRKGALTFKSQAFFVAMHDLVLNQNPGVKYFFKTDDDCYINVKSLEHEIDEESKIRQVDYWGECHDNQKPIRNPLTRWYVSYMDYPYTYYPKFCAGPGYVISTKYLECAVGEGYIQKVPYLTNEDGAAGLIAEKCGIEPQLSTWISLEWHMRDDLTTRVSVQHKVISDDVMIELHENALRTRI